MSGPYVNERAAAGWVAVLLGRGSAAEVGSHYPRQLWVGEVIDHSRTDMIELGSRVYAWLGRPPATFRERL
jgi:hypothetical protein